MFYSVWSIILLLLLLPDHANLIVQPCLALSGPVCTAAVLSLCSIIEARQVREQNMLFKHKTAAYLANH